MDKQAVLRCSSCDSFTKSAMRWLEPKETGSMDQLRESVVLRPRHVLFSEGQVIQGVHCIRSGAVKISRNAGKRRSVVMRIAGPGDLLGTIGIESAPRYTYGAETIEETQTCFLPWPAFNEVRDSSRFYRGIACALSRDLSGSEENLCNLSSRSLRQRIAFVLLDLSKRYGIPAGNGVLIGLKLSRRDLADLCGTVIESMARILSEFEGEGMLRLEGRRIHLLDDLKLLRVSVGTS